MQDFRIRQGNSRQILISHVFKIRNLQYIYTQVFQIQSSKAPRSGIVTSFKNILRLYIHRLIISAFHNDFNFKFTKDENIHNGFMFFSTSTVHYECRFWDYLR